MTNEQITPSKKITVGLILSWIFGILFALTGIITVFSEPIPGIVMLIMAAILLPPINKLVDKKWKLHLSGGMKIVVIIIGFIIFGSTIDTSETEKQQNNQSQIQQEQEQSISNTEQQKDEAKPIEEQPKTANNEKPIETEKTEIIPTADEEKSETPEEKPAPTKDVTVPAEYKSALAKADNYANDQHMSKKGLFKQLTSEYGEQFTDEAAQYAVDNVKTDWKANALAKATSYANDQYMSKQGIYDQLISEYGEQFTKAEAQHGIDNVQADWNVNALAKAKNYQEGQNMSPAAIHDQLTSEYGEQFTRAEADYAIQHLNN